MRTKGELKILTAPNYRLLIKNANELGITKEDIVKIDKSDEQIIMVYYG